MNQYAKVWVLSCVFILGISGSAMALTLGVSSDGPGNSLQDVFNDFTIKSPQGDNSSSVNTETDAMADSLDSFWQQTATGQSAVAMIVEIAGYAGTNKFGIYDVANPDAKVELFDGADAPGIEYGGNNVFTITNSGKVFVNNVFTEIMFSGPTFGFYLDSSAGAAGGVFYSDSALNNQLDHLAVYQGTNTDYVRLTEYQPASGLLWTNDEYILAWEDKSRSADWDYNDMVIMIESVNPYAVPEPGTIGLLGIGMIGILTLGRKRGRK